MRLICIHSVGIDIEQCFESVSTCKLAATEWLKIGDDNWGELLFSKQTLTKVKHVVTVFWLPFISSPDKLRLKDLVVAWHCFGADIRRLHIWRIDFL
jgi:hypothetical protein